MRWELPLPLNKILFSSLPTITSLRLSRIRNFSGFCGFVRANFPKTERQKMVSNLHSSDVGNSMIRRRRECLPHPLYRQDPKPESPEFYTGKFLNIPKKSRPTGLSWADTRSDGWCHNRTKSLSLNNISLTESDKGTCEHDQAKVA